MKTAGLWIVLSLLSCPALAADWTTWRSDSARSGYTAEALPPKLTRLWSWQPLHPPTPAWPRDERMSFDRAHHVVTTEGLVIFGSSANGIVTALDAETGQRQWQFLTAGPVRFAPTIWNDHVFVVSDDGYLYELKSRDGKLVRRWRGGRGDDLVLGNEKLTSKWPARGGPVLHDGILYWAAGIWQSEGVFLHALNPETGEFVWTNDKSGGLEMPQPHGGANAKSGVSAQGYLFASNERLFVPTGRAVPAAFRRDSGAFEYYHLQANTHRGGTSAMLANGLIYNGGYAYQTKDGSLLPDRINGAVAAFAGGIVHADSKAIRALKVGSRETRDRRGKPVQVPSHEQLWTVDDVPCGTSLIVCDETIVSSGGNRIATVDSQTQKVTWSAEVDDVAYGLAAANGRLYVSTASGMIHCFGSPATASSPSTNVVKESDLLEPQPYGESRRMASIAAEILQRSGIRDGYCLDLGCGDGQLAYELAKQSNLVVVAIDSDPAQVDRAKQRLTAAGLYGSRISVQLGELSHTRLPKYFANLIVSQRSTAEATIDLPRDEIARLQRPFGGVTCFGPLESMQITTRDALPGAGEWTHLYSNPANTLCSTDSIKGPLTAVWFRDIDLNLPQRHGRGPSPLFYQGTLIVEGVDELIAVDAYNGRPLWRFEQPGILDAYNADHLAGTAVTGSNMCIADGSVFLRNGKRCFQIDLASGKVQATFETPEHPQGKTTDWGYIACADGILFGSTANESHIVRHAYIRADSHMKRQYSESTSLFAFDVASKQLLWHYKAKQSIRHNAIAIGSSRLYFIDRALAVDDLLSRAPERRGQKPKTPPQGHPTGELIALDTQTGDPIWESSDDVFGTSLALSEPHDTLLMFYQPTSFRLPSEVGGRIAAHYGGDGQRLWDKKVSYRTRPLINDATIVAHPTAINIKTGEPVEIDIPKSYGCGQLSGSQNLLMFRSGTLGYFDFTRDAGTENYGGIRPGCWINALPVGGLVLVPDASAGCRCSYQNRSWVALEGR